MNPTQASIEKIQRSVAEKVRHRRAQDAQDLVGQRLKLYGFSCIAAIATPKALKKARRLMGLGGITETPAKLMYMRKVAGDFYAMWRGRGALVEVKRREEPTLAHSDLEPHQIQRLNEWHIAGGRSFLVWVRPGALPDSVAIIPWELLAATLGQPRHSITWQQAETLRLRLTR